LTPVTRGGGERKFAASDEKAAVISTSRLKSREPRPLSPALPTRRQEDASRRTSADSELSPPRRDLDLDLYLAQIESLAARPDRRYHSLFRAGNPPRVSRSDELSVNPLVESRGSVNVHVARRVASVAFLCTIFSAARGVSRRVFIQLLEIICELRFSHLAGIGSEIRVPRILLAR